MHPCMNSRAQVVSAFFGFLVSGIKLRRPLDVVTEYNGEKTNLKKWNAGQDYEEFEALKLKSQITALSFSATEMLWIPW